MKPADIAALPLDQAFENWPTATKEPILNALWSKYSTVLDVRVEGERDDYLLWKAVDVRKEYGYLADPDSEHLAIALLILEGAVAKIASANWDGLIELSVEQLSPNGRLYIPARAFKNWQSRFFRNTPLQITLPNVSGLYHWIDVYLRRHRRALLGGHIDPDTLFVRTLTPAKDTAELGASNFNHLWRNTIINFGIYNPYTKRGAIEGLLPHGPHAIRDVIATHIIKQTFSYELAAYALHCTPQVIERHYCGIVAAGKAELATRVTLPPKVPSILR